MKVIILSLLLTFSLFATNIENIIIFEVKTNFELDKETEKLIKTSLESSLTNLGYGIVSSQTREAALKEQKKQYQNDCLDDNCLIDTGKMLAAKKILIVDIDKRKEDFIIKMRRIDIETSILEASLAKKYSDKLSNFDSMDKIITESVNKIFKKISKNKIEKKKVKIITPPTKVATVDYNAYEKDRNSKDKVFYLGSIELASQVSTDLDDFSYMVGGTLNVLTMYNRKFRFDLFKIGYLKSLNNKFSFLKLGVFNANYYPIANLYVNFEILSFLGASSHAEISLATTSLTLGRTINISKYFSFNVYTSMILNYDIEKGVKAYFTLLGINFDAKFLNLDF